MIDFDYEQAMRQIRELRGIADDINTKSASKLSEAVDYVENSWKGLTANQFLTKLKEYESLVEKEASDIRSFADYLESVSKTIEKTELELTTES